MTHEANSSNLRMALRVEDEAALASPTRVEGGSRRLQYIKQNISDAEMRFSFGRWSLRDKLEWSCPTCTYNNQPLFLTCEMCGQARPPQEGGSGSGGQRASGSSTEAGAAAASLALLPEEEEEELHEQHASSYSPSNSKHRASDATSATAATTATAMSNLSHEDLREVLARQDSEVIRTERIKEIMALQQGIFSKIREENESHLHEEEESERTHQEEEENLEDSFSWMDLEDTLPIKDLPRQGERLVTKGGKPFDASNNTCTTAASSASYLSLLGDGSGHSHTSRGASRRSNNMSNNNMYPMLREVDEGGSSFHGSFAEDYGNSFAYGANSSQIGRFLGSSQRSLGMGGVMGGNSSQRSLGSFATAEEGNGSGNTDYFSSCGVGSFSQHDSLSATNTSPITHQSSSSILEENRVTPTAAGIRGASSSSAAGTLQVGTSPSDLQAALDRITAFVPPPSATRRLSPTRAARAQDAPLARPTSPFRALSPVDGGVSLEARLKESCTIRDGGGSSSNNSSNRSLANNSNRSLTNTLRGGKAPKNTPRSAPSTLAPPSPLADEGMPATPRDVPIPDLPLQRTTKDTVAGAPASRWKTTGMSAAAAAAPSSPRQQQETSRLPSKSTSLSNAQQGSSTTMATLPPTRDPIFGKNLYAERRKSSQSRSMSPKDRSGRTVTAGNKESSGPAIPILGRMLGKKKSAPSNNQNTSS